MKPSSAGNWDITISTEAPCVNPISTGELTSLSSQPKRPIPSISWMAPDNSAIHAASATHSALPGIARGASEAPTSKLVSAVGPTDRRADALHSTPTSAGMNEA